MSDLVSRNKVLEAIRSGTTHDDIRARIEIMEPVPAIPISVIEQIKADIAEIYIEGIPNGIVVRHKAIDIINHHIKEYTE